jgi:hypothetical protein
MNGHTANAQHWGISHLGGEVVVDLTFTDPEAWSVSLSLSPVDAVRIGSTLIHHALSYLAEPEREHQ